MRSVAVLTVGVAVGLAVGWATGPVRVDTVYETDIIHLPSPQRGVDFVEAEDWPTPYADTLVDWETLEAETDCLWEFLQQSGLPVTLRNVLAAGEWADVQGGACGMVGR